MRRRPLRILALFAAAFGVGVWLGAWAHAQSAPVETACSPTTGRCCRAQKGNIAQPEAHDAAIDVSCALCQLASAPLPTLAAVQAVETFDLGLPTHSAFTVHPAPTLLYYSRPGRAPPL